MSTSLAPQPVLQRGLLVGDHEFKKIDADSIFGGMCIGERAVCTASPTLGLVVFVSGWVCYGFRLPASARRLKTPWTFLWATKMIEDLFYGNPTCAALWTPDDAGHVPGRMAVTAPDSDEVLVFEVPPKSAIMYSKRIPYTRPVHVAARGKTMVVANRSGEVGVLEQRGENLWVPLRIVRTVGSIGPALEARHVWLSSDGKEFAVQQRWSSKCVVFCVDTGDLMGHLASPGHSETWDPLYAGGWTVERTFPAMLTHRGQAGERQRMGPPDTMFVADMVAVSIETGQEFGPPRLAVSKSAKQMEAMSAPRVGWMVAVARAVAHREALRRL